MTTQEYELAESKGKAEWVIVFHDGVIFRFLAFFNHLFSIQIEESFRFGVLWFGSAKHKVIEKSIVVCSDALWSLDQIKKEERVKGMVW